MGIQELMSLSAQTASQIQMRLPPINAPALIVRFSQELHIPQVCAVRAFAMCQPLLATSHEGCQLPSSWWMLQRFIVSDNGWLAHRGRVDLLQEVAGVALQMFEVHLAGTPQMRLQDDIHMHPHSHIMAVVIVAIKLVYGLDAEDAQGSTDHALDWQSWANAVVGSSRGPTTFPKSALEVLAFPSLSMTCMLCMPVMW